MKYNPEKRWTPLRTTGISLCQQPQSHNTWRSDLNEVQAEVRIKIIFRLQASNSNLYKQSHPSKSLKFRKKKRKKRTTLRKKTFVSLRVTAQTMKTASTREKENTSQQNRHAQMPSKD